MGQGRAGRVDGRDHRARAWGEEVAACNEQGAGSSAPYRRRENEEGQERVGVVDAWI